MDTPQGYHQIRVKKASHKKLGFAGVDAIKWMYNVMPFRPVNRPPIFIMMMHGLDGTWKTVATSHGINVGKDADTRIIINDILNFCRSFKIALDYIECILQVCRLQNLSLCLRKCMWLPERVEFVGIDVCLDGNRPAQSKHQLLQAWPKPRIVRDVASFVCFAIFYCAFIPLFKVHVKRLCELMKNE
jgi:hypothetical protein